MTKLLDDAIAQIRRLPEPQQDEIATIMLELAGEGDDDLFLTAEQIAEIERRLSDDEPLASDSEVQELFDRLAR